MSERIKQANSLAQLVCSEKRLSVCESIRIYRELLSGIDERHEEGELLLHLDPDDILLTRDKGKYQPSVQMRSRLMSDKSMEPETIPTGFRAPEVALRNISKIGKQSDYYSAAAIFYYCLTGNRLGNLQMFHSGTPDLSVISADLGKNAMKILRRILRKGLAYSLRCRYRSTAEIQKDLTELEKCFHRV